MKIKDQSEVKVIRSVCMAPCGEGCGIVAHVKNGVLTKVEPADFPKPGHRYMCRKGLSMPKALYHPDRLKYPLKRVGERGEGKWQRISWEEALDTITSKFKDIAARYGQESVGLMNGGLTIPNGALFIGQRFASASGATWIRPDGAGLAGQQCADLSNFGTRWSIPYLEDHKEPRLCVLWGSNTIQGFSWKYKHRIRPAREKGARMVVISPLFTPTAAKADEWIPIRPGTDVALALGMINIIMKEGLCDEAFLTKHTVAPLLVRDDNGLFLRDKQDSSGKLPGKCLVWDTKINKPQAEDAPGAAPALRGSYTVNGVKCKPAFQLLVDLVEQYPLDRVAEITEIAPDVIRKFALDNANLKPVYYDRGLSLQRAFHGDLAYRAINALAAVTGNICLKRPDQDLFTALNWGPFFFPGGRMYKTLTTFRFHENHLTGKPYPIKALWVSSHNPANSHTNRNNFIELMKSMEFTVVTELFMSATADYADIVLPGCTTFECTNLSMPWTAQFGGGVPYLQLQPKLVEPLYESKSDVEIFTEVARRMGLGEFFTKSAEEYIELLLASGNPQLEGITLEKLREGPLEPKPYALPLFHTPSGRLEFYVEKLKEFGQELPVYIESPESARQPLAQKYPLSFLMMHSRGKFHSMLSNVESLRELDPEPVVNISPVDAEKRDIKDGDMVTVFNDRGRVKVKTRFHEGMRPGVVTMLEGWQPRHFAEGHYQNLTSAALNPAQEAIFMSVGQIQGVLVEVKKA